MNKVFSNPRWCRIAVILSSGVLFVTSCLPKERDFPTSPTLREFADQHGILIGAAARPHLGFSGEFLGQAP